MALGSLFGVPSAVRGLAGRGRCHARSRGRAHVQVRGLDTEGGPRLRDALRRELTALEAVDWAEVNEALGRVIVAFDEEQLDLAAIVEVIAAVETAHAVAAAPLPARCPDHPGDDAPVRQATIALAGGVAGLGLSVVGRVVRTTPLAPEAAALVSLVEATPRLRHALQARLGGAAADLALAAANATAQGLAHGTFGLGVDVLHHVGQLTEVRSRRDTWRRREPELTGRPEFARSSADLASCSGAGERAEPGAAARYADRAAAAGLAAAGGTALVSRSPRRAVAALVAATPKAARLGPEAYAAGIGRAAAARGVVVLDRAALRRLDVVDTVVIDARLLLTGRLTLASVAPLDAEADTSALTLRAARLLDASGPDGAGRQGRWGLARLSGSPGARTAVARRAARAAARAGARLLALRRDEALVAVVAVVPELEPLAEPLARAAREAAQLLVAGGDEGLISRLGADAGLPGGRRLASALGDLREAGHATALVAGEGDAALRAAAVGIGVLRHQAPPPWGADLLCGPGLAPAALVLAALRPASDVSRRSVRLAGYGSAAGALLSFAGPPWGATARAALPVNGAALAALAVGTLSASAVARRPLPVAVDATPWHALEPDQVLARLESAHSGLSASEAARRHASAPSRAGARDLTVGEAALEELENPLTPALATGAGMSAASGGLIDAVVIGAVMGVNALIGGAQRVRAERALRALERTAAVRVRLRRDGAETGVTADALVPGDVIMLHAGDAVPADCRLLEATGLEVDESSLTGESQLVEKGPDATPALAVADRTSMLYAGTTIAAGEALALVVRTGPATEAAAGLYGERRRGEGVQSRLREMTKRTVPLALGAGGAVVAAGLARGRPLAATLGTGVGLAVAAVPEGLPLIATVAQLSAAHRLSRRGALVRNPATLEALGRVDVLCIDKTGTLTEGRIRLHAVWTGDDVSPSSALDPAARAVLAAGLRACPTARPDRPPPHPTDGAVLDGGRDAGVAPDEGLAGWVVGDELPFEPSRGYHAVLGSSGGEQRLAVKGAPEVVLPRCTTWRREGRAGPLDAAASRALDAAVERLARRGHRVLAVAERAASGRSDLDDDRVQRLTFLGLLALTDPVRSTAAEAVSGVRAAGVRTVMVTGDHPSTAEAIAAELDLIDGLGVATGADLDACDDAQLPRLISTTAVFARVTPAQKVRIVRALQADRHVVAVTGDGANDAPAIRLADVGVALGQRGTNAARVAADLVVTDDRIETIVDAIVEGRALWASVRDAVSVLLGGNLGEIAFTLAAGALGPRGSALNARQLLLVNLLTDMLPSMALAIQPPRGRDAATLLHEGPEASLGAALTRDVLLRAGTTAGAACVAYALGHLAGPRQASTTALVGLVGAQLGQTALAGWRSPLVLAASGVSVVALGAVVQTPGLSAAFGCRPLTPLGWGIGVGAAVGGTVVAGALPALLRARQSRSALVGLSGSGRP